MVCDPIFVVVLVFLTVQRLPQQIAFSSDGVSVSKQAITTVGLYSLRFD